MLSPTACSDQLARFGQLMQPQKDLKLRLWKALGGDQSSATVLVTCHECENYSLLVSESSSQPMELGLLSDFGP
jgi:hypothetical protein